MIHGADNPNRVGLLPGEKPPHDVPSWHKGNFDINWLNTSIITIPPLMVLGAIIYGVPLTWSTFIVAVIFYYLNGFGITVGYHRLFSHRSFVASRAVQYFFGFFGAGALQGSIKWWARNHRIHHNYIDTPLDPYDATRGFIFSHIGWLVMKQDYSVLGYVDISDLHANKWVTLQHKYYGLFALLSGIVLPTVVCGLLSGDWLGGYFYAALAKVVFVHHSTFFINSLAHSPYLGGHQPFSENHTSRDSWICSLLALGEGGHNLHHEFSQLYVNSVDWFAWDPSKWLIRALEAIGHAKHLVRLPSSVIERNMATVEQRKAERQLEQAKTKLAQLDSKTAVPTVWTWADVERLVRDEGRKLIVVGNYVLDIERPIRTGKSYTHGDSNLNWSRVHPGGAKLLDAYVGKDATEAMAGQVYRHSEGAFNLLQHLRVASIKRDE